MTIRNRKNLRGARRRGGPAAGGGGEAARQGAFRILIPDAQFPGEADLEREIAALVAWLCSEECSFSTGAVFDLSGGRATY